MKKHFFTGLIILAPLALTLAILIFIFNLLTEPFAGVVATIFDRYDLMESGFLFLNGRQLQVFVAQVLILTFLFFLTVTLGMIARYFFFNTLVSFWEYVIRKIPVISTIYKASQDVIKTIFGSKNNSFKQVVLVPFPSLETKSIGLVTRDDITEFIAGQKTVSVFVPTTPNPTSGFLMLYKPEDLVYLDMKVEDAFKYILSCGVILTPCSVIEKNEK